MGGTWFNLSTVNADLVTQRLSELLPIYQALQADEVKKRLGQALEIAVFRALLAQDALQVFLGAFLDLDDHDDSMLYRKEEPPKWLGKRDIGGDRRLDFLANHPQAGWAGLEIKNIREWIYPDRREVLDLLSKCIAMDVVPVLIARRIHFSTFLVLNTCGVIFHQTFNQRFAAADSVLAAKASHKTNLGFHDIRVGNHPDPRLLKFISVNLPAAIPEHRQKFDDYKDLLENFANDQMPYREFAARVRRRREGRGENSDWEDAYK